MTITQFNKIGGIKLFINHIFRKIFLISVYYHSSFFLIALDIFNPCILPLNVPSKSLLSVRGMKGCVSSGEYYLSQGSFGFLSQNKSVL